MSKNTEKNCRLGVVGGQAVLEGVMMKHKDRYSVAVRKEDGEITVKNGEFVSIRKKKKFFNIPIIRGIVNMIEMLMLSVETLNTSAELCGLEEADQETKFEKWLKKHFGATLLDVVMVIGVVLGVGLALGLFLFLPAFLTSLIDDLTGNALGGWKNLIEGVMKVAVFISYLLLCTLMKDIRRTFEYHGAEHKSIFCYEAGEELTPENVKKYRRFHPRCGTSFLFVIIIISVVVSMLPIFRWDNIGLRFLTKIAFMPIIVGLGFEFIMYAGKHDNILVKILSAPGLWMQRITTREPDLQQIEVAIYALKSSMPHEFPDFICPEYKAEENEPDKVADGQTDAEKSEVLPQKDSAEGDGEK